MNIFINATAGVIMVIAGIVCIGDAIAKLAIGSIKQNPMELPQVGDMYACVHCGNDPGLGMAALSVIVAPPQSNEVEHVRVFVDAAGRAVRSDQISKSPLSLFTNGDYYIKVLQGKGGIDADILPPKP